MLLSCPANLAPSEIMQNLKGKSSKLLQEEFPKLKKKWFYTECWGVLKSTLPTFFSL